MKRRDLEAALRRLGWSFLRAGGSHDIWSCGVERLAIPRHGEIAERLAQRLLKQARDLAKD